MIKRYVEIQAWSERYPEKIVGKVKERFERAIEKFDDWASGLSLKDRDYVARTIKAAMMVIRVFPESRVIATNVPGRRYEATVS